MRIEFHKTTTYISHGGSGIFFNQIGDHYEIKTTERVAEDMGETQPTRQYWRTVKVIEVSKEELALLTKYLEELLK
jgi:hypothetical protein